MEYFQTQYTVFFKINGCASSRSFQLSLKMYFREKGRRQTSRDYETHKPFSHFNNYNFTVPNK